MLFLMLHDLFWSFDVLCSFYISKSRMFCPLLIYMFYIVSSKIQNTIGCLLCCNSKYNDVFL